MKIRKILKIAVLTILTICIIISTVAFFKIRAYVVNAINTMPYYDLSAIAPKQETTYIYDADGSLQLKLSQSSSNRETAALSEIPENMQNAFIAIEDTRFYSHKGIDPIRIAGAFIRGIISGSFDEGASTITQQLIKNNLFPEYLNETTFDERMTRKVREQYLALEIEKQYSKQEILENYLNTISLGAGTYGVQAASYQYFNKPVSELNLSECAVIAGITQNPSKYDPILYPENNNRKRLVVLEKMQEEGFITEQEQTKAANDDPYTRIAEAQTAIRQNTYTYYQDALITQIINDLITQRGYTEQQAVSLVYSGGLRIWSAQNPVYQKICDEEFENPDNFPENTEWGIEYRAVTITDEGTISHGNADLKQWANEILLDRSFNLVCSSIEEAKTYTDAYESYLERNEGHVSAHSLSLSPQPQASIVIIDQSTGLIQALCGGRGKKNASLTFNRATQALRQPGSTFKILTAYAPALEEKTVTTTTPFEGQTLSYADGTPVTNWFTTDNAKQVSMREAVIKSINTAAVDCIRRLTPEKGFEYAEKFGITTLVTDYEKDGRLVSDAIEPLALGGITQGVTNLELTAAYAVIANKGEYIRPMFYTKVTDRDGNILLTCENAEHKTVLSKETAFEITNIMEDVIKDPNGTAFGTIDLGEMPAAGKTGTTSDSKDVWFVGYTRYYTCGVWSGYDSNKSLSQSVYNYHEKLWNSIMLRIHENHPVKNFNPPDTVKEISVCTESHMRATKYCPDTVKEWVTEDQIPERCTTHKTRRDAQ